MADTIEGKFIKATETDDVTAKIYLEVCGKESPALTKHYNIIMIEIDRNIISHLMRMNL